MNRYLWDVLLYACMGCFSYFFLVHYADIPVRLQDRLMTFHTFLAVIVSFCGVGLSMRYINERLLTYYPYFLRNKRMLSAGLIAAAVILLLSNYLLLVSVKALAGVASPFHLQRSGLTVILLVWLVELVIVGQFILNRFYVDVVRLYKRAEELNEELQFLDTYVLLQKVRLGDCLQVDNRIADKFGETPVPPLSLQLLVENVIKHNVISMKKPMTVKMWTEPRGDDVWICVANAVGPKQGGVTSGKGLENLSQRYRLLCGKEIVIEQNEKEFIVKLPLLYDQD